MSEFTHEAGSTSGDAEALAAVAAARRSVADRLVTPWWYHPALGLLLGGFTVAVALGDWWVTLVGLVVFAAGAGALVAAYRRRTGIWLSGHEPGPANRWSSLMGVVAGLGIAAAILLAFAGVPDVWVWVVAAAIAVVIVPIGRRYDRELRADLRGER
ncbi:hypothetical protein [Aeromicrobium sp. Leaf350]|uniref:hypothetical protein n=1 Tax=Aeromicrobium sp. Leaf350 TaxID=2876565 RepID=UPI001E5A7D74|nr:hypothetical protein [Aeromicrobium sp. Leaf350]